MTRHVNKLTRGLLGWCVSLAFAACLPDTRERSAYFDTDPTVCPQPEDGSNVRVLACRQTWISGLTVDEDYLYFLAGNAVGVRFANSVKRMPLTGGTLETISTYPALGDLPFDTTASNGAWLAANELELVWTVPSMGTIMAAPRAGGAPRLLVEDQDVPLRLALDSSRVYWTNWSNCGACSAGSVQSVALSGGAPQLIAAAQDHPNGIALDPSNVYWATAGGTVMQAARAGGAPLPLARDLLNPFFVMVDPTTVYWTMPGSVMSCPIGGGDGRPIELATGLQSPNVMVGDGTALYFSDWSAGTVMKLVRGDATLHPIATGIVRPNVVVLSGPNVYWYTAGPEGSIMTAPR